MSKEQRLQDLRREYSELTSDLKSMTGYESDYAQVWNKRAHIVDSIKKLEKEIKNMSVKLKIVSKETQEMDNSNYKKELVQFKLLEGEVKDLIEFFNNPKEVLDLFDLPKDHTYSQLQLTSGWGDDQTDWLFSAIHKLGKQTVKELCYFELSLLDTTNPKVDFKHVKKIVKNFDPEKFLPISVYYDEETKRAIVTDGNHRIEVAKMLGFNSVASIMLTKEEFDYVKYSKRHIDMLVLIPDQVKVYTQDGVKSVKNKMTQKDIQELKQNDTNDNTGSQELPTNK